MLTYTRSAVAHLQRFSEVHNPAFPGYRRTLQPMDRPHASLIRRIVLSTAAALMIVAALWGACLAVALVSAGVP